MMSLGITAQFCYLGPGSDGWVIALLILYLLQEGVLNFQLEGA